MNRKERTVFVALVVNALVIGLKFWLAGASGSLSLQASAIHSVSDTATLIFVLLGLFLMRWESRRRSDVSRIENWVALGVALAIFYIGFDIVREVLLMNEPPELQNIIPVLLASLVTIPVDFLIARYLQYVGRQTSSAALVASGYHAQVDIFASTVVVVGLVGAALGLPSLDRAAAAVVVVFVLFAGYEIISSAWHALTHSTPLEVEHTHAPNASGLWRGFAPIAALILFGLYWLSGIYTVQPSQVAVVRTFGRVTADNVGPGLHYRLPWPIDQVDIVDLSIIRRAETPASLMLTGDASLLAIRLSMHYAVNDPAAFLLNVADPEALVTQAGEAALRQVVAQASVDGLLTTDKAFIQQRAVTLAQQTLDGYRAGLTVLGVQLLESNPPPEVADAFRDVASAREDRNTFINEALAYQNEVIPLARGYAEKTIQAANAYRAEKLAQAMGEAVQFTRQQGAYAEAPVVTRLRLYLEAVEQVLPGARKFVLDSAIRLQTTDLWIPGGSGAQTFPAQP